MSQYPIIKEGQQKLKELTEYVNQYEKMVETLLEDEYSRVPINLKLEFKKNADKIKECL